MIRSLMLACAVTTLTSCQMTTPTNVDTREDRLIRSQNIIDACVRSECGRLNLDSNLVEDYSIIAPMTHVTALMASFTDFDDLNDIADMRQLRELHIGVSQVPDLSGLSNFPNLTLLHAQNLFNVSDFTPVGQLNGLTELAIGGNDVGDLGFVRPLRNLTDLNLANAQIGSLMGLNRHPSLQVLDLVDASLPDDLSVLKTIPNLRRVSISDWALSDAQKATLDDLRTRGVTVDIAAAVIVC